MLKATTWSLLSGGFLAAGVAYAYARRARALQLEGELHRPLALSAEPESLAAEAFEEESLADDEDEFEIELVDLDAVIDEGEAYDAISPDNLGALWLSRATQTSGVRASPGIQDDSFEDEDDLDPAGRPTEPPEEPRDTMRDGSSHRS